MMDLDAHLKRLGYHDVEMLTSDDTACDFRKVIIYARELRMLAGMDAELHFYECLDSFHGRESTLKAACLIVAPV